MSNIREPFSKDEEHEIAQSMAKMRVGGAQVDEIVASVAQNFRCFGRGLARVTGNPIAEWTQNEPPQFALGVDVGDVVRFVLVRADTREWRDISTAPKDRRAMLLYLSGEGYHGPRPCNIVTGIWTDSGWYCICDGYGGVVSGQPTHWQPLPAPPSEGEK